MEITREDIINVISILRKVTMVVKLIPFIYAFLYVANILTYWFCDECVISWVDMLFYMSPVAIIFMLILSRTLKLCKWHRLECVLPLMGFASLLVNDFVVEFGKYGQLANYIIVIATFILSLINAYFVFIHKPNIK